MLCEDFRIAKFFQLGLCYAVEVFSLNANMPILFVGVMNVSKLIFFYFWTLLVVIS